jgi:hypothetical protein
MTLTGGEGSEKNPSSANSERKDNFLRSLGLEHAISGMHGKRNMVVLNDELS